MLTTKFSAVNGEIQNTWIYNFFTNVIIGFSRIVTLNNWLSNNNYDVKKIWKEIDDVIIKTIILSYPFVKRSYQAYFSGHKYTSACFEILGFDILLDENCKPHLLEVRYYYTLTYNVIHTLLVTCKRIVLG